VELGGPNLGDAHALAGVDIEHAVQEGPCLLGHIGRNLEVPPHDLVVKGLRVRIVEGQVPTQQGEQNDARRPNVRLQRVVLQSGDHFWRGVAGRPAGRLEHLVFLIRVRQSEVHDFYFLVLVQQQVFRLQVSEIKINLWTIFISCRYSTPDMIYLL